jgi:hypothetical protein
VQQWPQRHIYAVCARRTERWDAHAAEALLGGAAEGSYEQEAAAVEEDDKMEREDEGGVAKRPDLNGATARCAGVGRTGTRSNRMEDRKLLQHIAL